MQVDELTILSRSTPLPFQLDEEGVDETLRLRYRWLDLRRERMQRNIRTRAKARLDHPRRRWRRDGFVDIETPIMGKPTPEGARDFLIPTRLQPGRFFALPQSPQLYKQLLVIAGFERYYQIARCFRDEDLRADRLQELTQLDVEMAFPDLDELLRADRARSSRAIWRECRGVELETPFPRMNWDEADLRYGSDKPDLRFGLEIEDATAHHPRLRVRGLREREGRPVRFIGRRRSFRAARSRSSRRSRRAGVRRGSRTIVFRADGEVSSPIAKFLSPEVLEARAQPGTTALFGADEPAEVSRILGFLRLHLGRELGLVDESRLAVHLGHRLPHVQVGSRPRALGCGAPSVHAPDRRVAARCSTPIRARLARSPTTSSATAASSPAARSGSTSRSCRRRSSTS